MPDPSSAVPRKSPRTRLARRAVGLASVLCLLTAANAPAQYTAPGSGVIRDNLQDEDALRARLNDARWRLGPMRLGPWFGLRDFAYVTGRNEAGAETDKLTATAGLGVRAYMKTGRRLVWAAHVLPEYAWWQDDEAKESLNGRYGAALFGYFNRLDLELSARRHQRQEFFSSEVQELTSNRVDTGRLAFDLELADEIVLSGSLEKVDVENREKAADRFNGLDRSEESGSLGMRFEAASGWYVGVGFTESTVDFAADVRDLSHRGTAGFFNLGFIGERFSLQWRSAQERLTARDGSLFKDLEATTGAIEASRDLGRAMRLFAYGRRDVRFSTASASPAFVAERYGARLDISTGAARSAAYVELGQDVYEGAARTDDVRTVGTTLGFEKVMNFVLHAAYTEYDSNQPGLDREVFTWGLAVLLGRNKQRFQIGENDQVW